MRNMPLLAALAATVLTAAPALAQRYPTKPVRIIVPATPAGPDEQGER